MPHQSNSSTAKIAASHPASIYRIVLVCLFVNVSAVRVPAVAQSAQSQGNNGVDPDPSSMVRNRVAWSDPDPDFEYSKTFSNEQNLHISY